MGIIELLAKMKEKDKERVSLEVASNKQREIIGLLKIKKGLTTKQKYLRGLMGRRK